MSQRTGGDEAEIVEQSGRYALIRDPDGAAIYDLDLGSDADPVASYPSGDEGFDAAWRRYGELVKTDRRERFGLVRILGAIVVVGVAVWIVAGLGYAWIALDAGNNGSFSDWYRWVQVAETVSFHVWLGALALLILLWLRLRLDPDRAPIAPRRRASADRGSDQAAP